MHLLLKLENSIFAARHVHLTKYFDKLKNKRNPQEIG